MELLDAAILWQTTFDSISDWVTIHGANMEIIKSNKSYSEFFALKAFSPDTKSFQRVKETGKPFLMEVYDKTLKAHLEASTFPVFNKPEEIGETAKSPGSCRCNEIKLVVASRPNKPQAFNAPCALPPPRNGFKSGFATGFADQRFRRWMASGQSPVFIPALPAFLFFRTFSGAIALPIVWTLPLFILVAGLIC